LHTLDAKETFAIEERDLSFFIEGAIDILAKDKIRSVPSSRRFRIIEKKKNVFQEIFTVFWSFFLWCFGGILSNAVYSKTVATLAQMFPDKSREDIQDERFLFGARKNFGRDAIPEIHNLEIPLFTKGSPLMKHFCRNVANAPALDDVYNIFGSFTVNGERVFPEAHKRDLLSLFHLGLCPNGFGVRWRYRTVIEEAQRALSRKSEVSILSVACGSAQPVLHLSDILRNRGVKVKTTLTDASQSALDLALRRAEEFGVSNLVESFQALFVKLRSKFAGQHFDLVEVCGLFDYCSDKAVSLCLKNALALGDVVLVSNMIDVPRESKMLRMAYNWEPVYRPPYELASLLEKAGGQDIEVIVGPWGIHAVALARSPMHYNNLEVE